MDPIKASLVVLMIVDAQALFIVVCLITAGKIRDHLRARKS